MPDDAPPPSPAEPVSAEADTADSTLAPLASLKTTPPQPPAPPRRRRFDAPAVPAGGLYRQGIAFGGLALLIFCLHGIAGVPWPSWHTPALPEARRNPGGAVAVVIDPGHGGGDSGAVAQGVVEKDLNLDVGRRVAGTLSARGVAVLLTREDDRFVPLPERVRLANAQPGAVFVSIHFNDASGDGRVAMNRASGIETFYSDNKEMSASPGGWMWASLFGAGSGADPVAAREVQMWSAREGAALASSIQSSLVATTAASDRGTKDGGLYVTRRVRGPAVLVEGGFVSHPAEARLLGDPLYRQKLADAIADGIVRYLDAAAGQPVPAAVAAASAHGI